MNTNDSRPSRMLRPLGDFCEEMMMEELCERCHGPLGSPDRDALTGLCEGCSEASCEACSEASCEACGQDLDDCECAKPHTPGPWNLTGDNGKEIFVEQNGDGWHRLFCEVTCDDCDRKTAMANALLISAAPDLLGACQRTLNVIRTSDELQRNLNDEDATAVTLARLRSRLENLDKSWRETLEAAIGKATGGPNAPA